MTERPNVVKQQEVHVDETSGVRRRRQVVRDVNMERRIAVAKIELLIWLLFGLLDMLLVFRFALKLIGANPNNDFARFIYDMSAPFMDPFLTLIESPTSGNSVLEIPVLVAILVYSLIAWVLVRLTWVLLYRPGKRVISTYEEEDQ
jgi:uncharacterized protein YggT (Ycf19 family)